MKVAMAWKPTGRPMMRQQRDRWVVRVDGLDTETGKPRWSDHGLVVATKQGNPVSPGNFDQTLERLVAAAGHPFPG
jgi:hypothetical protein